MVTVPLARRTARAVDLAIGERLSGPIFVGSDRRRYDRHIAGRVVRRVARRAGVNKPIGPHTLRHAFITALDAGVPLRDVQEAAAKPTRGRRCATTEPGSPSTATLPTSSPRTSPAPVVRNNRCSGRLSAKADARAALSWQVRPTTTDQPVMDGLKPPRLEGKPAHVDVPVVDVAILH